MFGCALKLIFGSYGNFRVSGYKPKYSYTITYEHENSRLSYELSYLIGLFNFSQLNLFQENVNCKK
jgi:hypothetical protein